eukprot:1711549-Pleurochrysis_carterae.AAC.1
MAGRQSALTRATVGASGAAQRLPSEQPESETRSRPSGGTEDAGEATGHAGEAYAHAPHEEGDAFLLRAARPIAAGEEVTLDYGPRANAELVTTHGFAIAGIAGVDVALLGSAADCVRADASDRADLEKQSLLVHIEQMYMP